MTDRSAVHAQRLVQSLPIDMRNAVGADAIVGLEDAGYAVNLREQADIASDCSVAGSFNAGPPPRITVVRTTSRGRQHFTALHELGHHLVAEDDELQDLLFDEPDGGERLEERICDAVAAELLLPAALVDGYIGYAGPHARDVMNLAYDSQASREACCVRAAERLPGPGHVMLARDGTALFTASRNTPYRVSRGARQDLGTGHITADAARRGAARGEAPVVYGSGTASERFFADAVRAEDGYIFAVFVDGPAPWLDGPTLYGSDRRDATEAFCPYCEIDFTTLAAPCSDCEDYRHHPGGCGRCSCQAKARTVFCTGCNMHQPRALFTPGEAECNECRGL